MPPRAWNDKRDRQYQHIKAGLEAHSRSASVAEAIAARTVNKDRARGGTRPGTRTSGAARR